MLGRLCLLLSIDDRDVRNADAQEVVAAKSVSKLLVVVSFASSRMNGYLTERASTKGPDSRSPIVPP
jgi:hypothetical protein